jgi:signal transduction histidine kinase
MARTILIIDDDRERSPLARLQVAVELARRKAGPDAEKHLNRIEAEGTRMNEMIGQILSLARTDSDRPAASRWTWRRFCELSPRTRITKRARRDVRFV